MSREMNIIEPHYQRVRKVAAHFRDRSYCGRVNEERDTLVTEKTRWGLPPGRRG